MVDFDRTGLVRLPGAVPAADAAAIVDRIWAHLANSDGVVRDRPETWIAGQPAGLRAITATPEFRALGSPAIRAAADELLGAGRWREPRRWGRPLVTFPSGNAGWAVPRGSAWHNDFVPGQAAPGVRGIQMFVILKDLEPRGGGTLVLTGSHHLVGRYLAESGGDPHPRRLRALLAADPWLRDLLSTDAPIADNAIVGDVDLRIVELTGRAGDAFVMHCDTFHAIAPNCLDEPRMMATNLLVRG
jgi:hypothetical protein